MFLLKRIYRTHSLTLDWMAVLSNPLTVLLNPTLKSTDSDCEQRVNFYFIELTSKFINLETGGVIFPCLLWPITRNSSCFCSFPPPPDRMLVTWLCIACDLAHSSSFLPPSRLANHFLEFIERLRSQ